MGGKGASLKALRVKVWVAVGGWILWGKGGGQNQSRCRAVRPKVLRGWGGGGLMTNSLCGVWSGGGAAERAKSWVVSVDGIRTRSNETLCHASTR